MKISYDPELVRLMQVQMMLEQVPTFAQILANKKWIIFENPHNIPLWTSDNPVALHNRSNAGYLMGNLGLTSLGIEIHFPLAKYLLMLSIDPRTQRLKKNATAILTPSDVVYENMGMQVMSSSSRFIYASSDNDFTRVKEFLTQYPQFRSRNQRMHVY
jgi:hypothetical protein